MTKIKKWGFYHGFAGIQHTKSYDLNLKSPKAQSVLDGLIQIFHEPDCVTRSFVIARKNL
jgi:hypothetical protein